MIEFLVPLVTFIAVVSLVGGIYFLWDLFRETGAGKVERRLRVLSAGGAHGSAELLKKKVLSTNPVLNSILLEIPRIHAIDRMLIEASIDLSVLKFISLQLAAGIFISVALALGSELFPWLAIVLGLTLGFIIPYLYISRCARTRRTHFIEMLPDALDFIARSLRAGNPFTATLKMVADEVPDPVGTEFGIIFDEINYGLEIKDAMLNFEERINCEEVQYFVAAVNIQKVTGGNLADVLNKISEVMRSRVNAYREVAIQASEMRLSANVLIGLPFFVAGAISILNPSYFKPLFESPVGQIIIFIQLFLMLIGYLVVKRMIHFRI